MFRINQQEADKALGRSDWTSISVTENVIEIGIYTYPKKLSAVRS